MTQNTQTTAERIFALIFENIGYTDGDDRTVAAIAAEIDRLAAERDAAREQIAGYEAGMRFQFDRAEDYKAQRDEARAEAREQIAALEASNAEQAQMMADGFADAKEQSARLADARAEIERLRLPAEAWETQEHYDSLRVAPMADVLAADAAMKVAAARARKAANLKKLVAEQEQAAARARDAKEAKS